MPVLPSPRGRRTYPRTCLYYYSRCARIAAPTAYPPERESPRPALSPQRARTLRVPAAKACRSPARERFSPNIGGLADVLNYRSLAYSLARSLEMPCP